MKNRGNTTLESGAPLTSGEQSWSFVYIFFTNHTPFDAPNRSEPCSLR